MGSGKVEGPEAGPKAVAAIPNRRQLDGHYLTHAVLGEFEAQLHHFETASDHLRNALELTELKSEQNFLAKTLQEFDARKSRLGVCR